MKLLIRIANPDQLVDVYVKEAGLGEGEVKGLQCVSFLVFFFK